MNAEHLAAEARTVFEALDAEDVRTAGTTYLMYRGRHTHEPAREFALSRIATATLFRRPVEGPRELFYADLFASRATGCWSQLGLPGMRDQHAGCVGAYLVEHDLFDFLLLSLPDNDTHSHKHGPHAQVASIAAADRQIERVMHAAGGPDAFLAEHAVIVVSDHSHAPVEEDIALVDAFDGWDDRRRRRAGRVRRAGGDRDLPVAARGDGLRPARGGARRGDRRRSWRRRASSRASTSSCGATGRRASSPPRAASCASRPARTCATGAARRGASAATSRSCGRAV